MDTYRTASLNPLGPRKKLSPGCVDVISIITPLEFFIANGVVAEPAGSTEIVEKRPLVRGFRQVVNGSRRDVIAHRDMHGYAMHYHGILFALEGECSPTPRVSNTGGHRSTG